MKRASSNHPAGNRAFALVLVLVIVSVLALVTVGFLASMGQERATANAFANKARAEQSAQAGVDTAMGILKDYFKAFPDSATVWEAQSTNSGGNNDGTTLYLRAVADASGNLPDANPNSTNPDASHADFNGGNGPNNVDATTGVDNRKIFVLPLTSGVQPTLLASHTLPASNPNDYVNLNTRRYIGDTQGWLGTPPASVYTGASPKPVWVPWVNVKQQDGVTAGATAPVVGRYAFWVEDESFRTNLSYADGGTAANDVRRDNAVNVSLDPTDVSLLGLFSFLGESNPTTARTKLLTTRNYYPGKVFPENGALAHADGLSTTTSDGLRFLTTPYSSALNLTRHGTQRLNLNALIPPTTLPTNTSAIQKQIDVIVKTLQFHLPNFGQRFYRVAPGSVATTAGGSSLASAILSGSVTDPKVLNQMAVTHNANSASPYDNYAKIYYYKEAANIRDYIDNDCF
ncbi:MAG: hypothetical protein INR62_03745, partial [Rhodospirillales bacterium]|nr:hypothetical protein [Acetobacter sp.]